MSHFALDPVYLHLPWISPDLPDFQVKILKNLSNYQVPSFSPTPFGLVNILTSFPLLLPSSLSYSPPFLPPLLPPSSLLFSPLPLPFFPSPLLLPSFLFPFFPSPLLLPSFLT